MTLHLNSFDFVKTVKCKIEKAVDLEFADHNENMMLKLFLSDHNNDEIAQRVGIERKVLPLTLYDCGRRLELHFGITLVDLREIYMGRKLIWG